MKTISAMWLRASRKAIDMLADRRGIAATEFAVIVPIMLVLFFGTVEFSSGVAVDRKVTLIAQGVVRSDGSNDAAVAQFDVGDDDRHLSAKCLHGQDRDHGPVRAVAREGDRLRRSMSTRTGSRRLSGASLRSSAATPPRRRR